MEILNNMSFRKDLGSSSSLKVNQVDPIILKCETFINEQLKNDLKIIHQRQESIHVQLNNFHDLKSFIVEVKNQSFGGQGKKSIKTQIDVGNNFYMRCTIPSTERITVFIGLGFYLELTLDEALVFIDKRSEFLNDCLDKLTDQSCKVKAHIKVILDALSYLQGLNQTDETD